MKIKIIYILLFLILSVSVSSAQIKEIGVPFIKNYTHEEYNSGNQNFSIVQDNRGVMYFANTNAVLEFDGTNWRQIHIPDNPPIYVLAKSKDGRIFLAAGNGDFGYLSADSIGVMRFISLSDKVSEDKRKKTQISRIFITPENFVVFVGLSFLYVYNNESVEVIGLKNKENRFISPFKVNGKIYLQERGKGILEYKSAKLELLKGTETFANKWVTGMFPAGDNKMYIVANRKAVYLYDNMNVTEIDGGPLILDLYKYEEYKSDYYLYGLFSKGMLITDKDLNIKKHISTFNGLQNNTVYSVFNDNDNNIWTGLANGISVFYENSPYSNFSKNYNLTATTHTSLIFENKLYLGSSTGVFYIERDSMNSLSKRKFTAVDNPKGASQIWKIDTANNVLLCASTNGFFYIDNNKANYIKQEESTSTFIRLSNSYILAAGGNGLYLYKFENQKWSFKHKIKGIENAYRYLEQDKDGTFWISDRNKGVYHFDLNKKMDSVIGLKEFNEKNGLPDILENYVYKINNKIVFGTKKGIFVYDKVKEIFEKDKFFNRFFPLDITINRLYQDPKGDIWFKEEKRDPRDENKKHWELGVIKFNKDSFEIVKTPFYRVKDNIHSFKAISKDELLIGTEKGFVHYDLTYNKNYNNPYHTLIRKIEIIENDSLIFGGTYSQKNGIAVLNQSEDKIPVIPYDYNSLKFSFSGLFFEEPDKIMYKYYLEGNDKGWSDWKPETVKEFSNLSHGNYVFKVKAKNVYGIESEIAEYQFVISPPWYKTIWAFIGYFMLTVFFIWGIVRLSIRRMRIQKQNLERIVKERTAEIIQKKEEIEAQRDQLEEQNEVINKKNKDIFASITYAQRIQEAMLPLKEKMSEALENFVLFKPRDIVSGDFYWFAEKKNKIVLSAVDCTGHGVPGAFMSMIGSEILTTIVNNEVLVADEILTKMNQFVKTALKQDTTSNQDGMDLALCVIDKEAKTVEFSGAKNPIVYINNGELTHVKGDRKGIGGFQLREEDYVKHLIKYESPTWFYIFTDGFQDQFGGPNKRKFMIKRLKEMFLSIHQKPLDMQHRVLNNAIEDWMEDAKQTDDILVIGFKL